MTRRQHISAPAHVWHSLTFFDHIFWACDLASWPFRAFFGRHFILLSSAQTMKLKHHGLLHSMKPGNPVSRSQAIVSLHSLRDKPFRSIYKLIPNHLHVLHVIYRNILVLWCSVIFYVQGLGTWLDSDEAMFMRWHSKLRALLRPIFARGIMSMGGEKIQQKNSRLSKLWGRSYTS